MPVAVSPAWVMLRLLMFVMLDGVLQWVWQSLRGSIVEYRIIHDLTVRPAAELVNWLTPAVQAQAIQFKLQAAGGGLNILNGCEGMDIVFLLCSAFCVAPMPVDHRVKGVMLGLLIAFALNQARILLLFYCYRANPATFDLLHSTVTPIAAVLLVGAYFHGWLRLAPHAHA